MNSEVPPSADDEPLAGAYRVVRRVGPPEAPLPARLARRDDDTIVMLADAATLDDWEGWRVSPDGHLLAARDLVRCAGGVALEVDWCPTSLAALLARRRRDGAALAPGEAVTLAVSVMRALGELSTLRARGAGAGDWPRGSWWLTAAGRPVFVHTVADSGDDEPTACESATALVRAMAELCEEAALRSLLTRLAAGLADWRSFEAGAAEEDLFRLAVAVPIDADPRPRRTSDASPAREVGALREVEHGRPGLLPQVGIDATLAELARQAFDDLRQRVRRARRIPGGRPRRRGAPWVLAGVAAAVVLAAGLLWPTGDGTPPAAALPSPSAPPAARAEGDAAAPDPSPTAAAPAASPSPKKRANRAGSDLAAVTEALLTRRTACGADVGCLTDIQEDPSSALPGGVIDLAPGERSTTILDEFGGAAVLRLDAKDGRMPSQLVVIVEEDAKWLLRDVHDVAQQPKRGTG